MLRYLEKHAKKKEEEESQPENSKILEEIEVVRLFSCHLSTILFHWIDAVSKKKKK